MSNHCQCLCDCGADAIDTDDQGWRVCESCAEYTNGAGGEVVCGHQTNGFRRCHDCGVAIVWGAIEVRGCGMPNVMHGTCNCNGRTWVNEDNGGNWDRFRIED